MKIVLAGGSGHIGQSLLAHFLAQGAEVVVLTRRPSTPHDRAWDGQSLGDWQEAIDGADVVINLAGKSVNCRLTPDNRRELVESRTFSTRVIGQAIAAAKQPPALWLNSSTATIYTHTYGPPNGDDGVIGGDEPGVPAYWAFSIEIAKAWEHELFAADTPETRRIALRSVMTMSTEPGSVFDVFCGLARKGLLGTLGNGRQYVSWIHQADFNRSIDFLIARTDLSGTVNIASPNPLPNAEFNRILREELRVPIGLPATEWMLQIGTFLMGTDAELVLKSRRVVPSRLLSAGFEFQFPEWRIAARDLIAKSQIKR